MMGFSGKTLLNIERLVCNHTVVGTYRLFDEHGVLVKSINQKSILEFVKSPQSLRKSLFKCLSFPHPRPLFKPILSKR